MNAKLDGLPGAYAPVLTTELVAHIYGLNLDFLELLIAEHAGLSSGGMSSDGMNATKFLPERVLDALVDSSQEARQALAAASYSLFSLGFEDAHFWRSALRFADDAIDARYGVTSAAIVPRAFCELALMHAWHVALTQPIAARLLYGMPTVVADRMARIQLWQLKRVAADYPGLLMPRWPTNPCFWPDMLKFAAQGDLRRLDTTHQLGRQLLAAELQACAVKRSAARQRCLLQHRLLKVRGG